MHLNVENRCVSFSAKVRTSMRILLLEESPLYRVSINSAQICKNRYKHNLFYFIRLYFQLDNKFNMLYVFAYFFTYISRYYGHPPTCPDFMDIL